MKVYSIMTILSVLEAYLMEGYLLTAFYSDD